MALDYIIFIEIGFAVARRIIHALNVTYLGAVVNKL